MKFFLPTAIRNPDNEAGKIDTSLTSLPRLPKFHPLTDEASDLAALPRGKKPHTLSGECVCPWDSLD